MQVFWKIKYQSKQALAWHCKQKIFLCFQWPDNWMRVALNDLWNSWVTSRRKNKLILCCYKVFLEKPEQMFLLFTCSILKQSSHMVHVAFSFRQNWHSYLFTQPDDLAHSFAEQTCWTTAEKSYLGKAKYSILKSLKCCSVLM